MIEEIKERIRSGYYINNLLTNNDYIIIINNKELVNELANFLSTSKIKLKFEDSYNSIFMADELYQASVGMDDEQKYFLLFNIISSESSSGASFNFNFIDAWDIKPEYKEKIKKEYEEYLLTTNDDIYFIMGEKTITKLLDEKRYDLINKIEPYNKKAVYELSDYLKERLKNEIPINQFGEKPNALFLENENYNLEMFSPEEVVDFFYRLDYPDDITQSSIILRGPYLKYIEYLSKKENDNSSYRFLERISFPHSNSPAEINFIYGSVENYKRILHDFAENGYFSSMVYSEIRNYESMSDDNFKKLLMKQLDRIDNPFELLSDFSFFIDDDIKDYLIDQGYGLYFYLTSYVSPEDMNKIKENIKIGKEKITKVSINHIYYLFQDEEISKYILNNNQITSIDFSYFFNTKSKEEDYYNLLKQEVLKNDIEIKELKIYDEEILEMLKQKKDYNKIEKILSNIKSNGNLDPKDYNMMYHWINKNINDVKLIDSLLNSWKYSTNISELKVFLKNEVFAEKIINLIKHDEELTTQLDKETFYLLKDYYSRMNKYNMDNIELLCNHFGPLIIFYLDDDDFVNFINLNKSKLEKIVNLFPMDKSLIDVEATNESIMQYAYKQDESKKEVIELFTDFKKACSSHDEKQINNKKYLLMSLVDISFFNKLKKLKGDSKYINTNHPEYKTEYKGINEVLKQIENMNLETAIDFLLERFEIDEYREVFKLLCDNAVCNDRRLYVSNYYYTKTNEFKTSDINKFIYFMQYVEEHPEGNTKEFRELHIKRLFDSLSKEYINKVLEKYNYSTLAELIDYLAENYTKSPKASFIIKEALNNSIVYLQSKSKTDTSLFANLKLPYELEEKSKKNEIEKFLIRKSKGVYVLMEDKTSRSLFDLIIDELVKQGLDKEIALETINYYELGEDAKVSSDAKAHVGQLFKVATKIIREVGTNNLKFDRWEINASNINQVIELLDKEDRIKRIYKPDVLNVDVYPILSNLNIELIEENILDNKNNYNRLLEIMHKTKPHIIEKRLMDFITENELPITDDISDVACFISFFGDIMEKESKKEGNNSYTIPEVLNVSGVYAAINSVYSLVLGSEDAKLIKKNPKPNQAYEKTRKNQRLKESINNTLKCFDREEVLIPSFDETYELDNGKQIECIVANFTAPCNMTHGERTGACMRIGGAGEKLYDFCINNKAGFHIRFEDPITHEYVSRVSGFRNGNSVFLNELRNSESKKYYSDDLYNATKWISNQLIDMTKDTDNPIENVFVTTAYAMADIEVDKIKLDGDKVKEGLGSLYTDYDTVRATVLATTADKDYKPINTGNEGIKPFKPVRTKPKEAKNMVEAASKVNRVKSINQLLKGVELSDLEADEFENGIMFAISTDDWYIYVTNQMQIESEYLVDNEEARIECELYKGIITQRINAGEIKEAQYGF